MTPEQIPQLIKQISYADNRVLPTDPDEAVGMAALWAVVLADVPYEYAITAVGQHYAKSAFTIRPADIASKWAATVRDRLQRHTDPAPAANPDDEATWRQQLAATRRAVAQGHIEPTPQAIAAGPSGAIAALTAGIGRTVPGHGQQRPYMPKHLRGEFADSIPRWGQREAARRRGGIDLYSVECPWCNAPAGQECRRRTIGKNRNGWHRRSEPHPSRTDSVATQAVACPICRAEAGVSCWAEDGVPFPGAHRERADAVLGDQAVGWQDAS